MASRTFSAVFVALCAFQDINSVTGNANDCDTECATTYPGSYCKYWKTPSTCFGSVARASAARVDRLRLSEVPRPLLQSRMRSLRPLQAKK
ncbi:hypothetical protein Pmar_PMAR001447, partial [Perkinsus marinus ATCC 50983]